MSVYTSAATRRKLAALAILVLVTAGGLFFFTARLVLAVYQLYGAAGSMYEMVLPPGNLDNAAFASELRRAGQALDVLQTESAWLEPLAAPLLMNLTRVSAAEPAASTIGDLLEASWQSLDLAKIIYARVESRLASSPSQVDMSATARTLALGEAVAGDFSDLASDFRELAITTSRVAGHKGLPQPLRFRFEQLAQGAKLAAAVATLGPHLDWLLGSESARTLLVLAQNNDELRATGGFISAAGTITLNRGRVSIDNLVDSYSIYREDVDHPPAPTALQKYMKAYILLLRDANWSPDGPASAQLAADLYELDTGVRVDGVLLLDKGALAHLLQAFGPVSLPQPGVTLTATNLEQQLADLWNPKVSVTNGTAVDVTNSDSPASPARNLLPVGWWEQRKDFVPQVAQAILERAQASSGDSLAAASAILEALNDRSLQLWVKDAGTARALNDLGWDGALDPQPGRDFLAVVDSNVGFNKVDAVIERSLSYAVDWPIADGTVDQVAPTATLTLTYTHTLSATDPGCDQTPRYGNSYAELTRRCYFDFLRVYTPQGSRLLSSSGLQPGSTTSERGEKGLQVFSGFLVQPPGTVHIVTLTYQLPAAIGAEDYALVLQRQAGVKPLPVSLRAGLATVALVLDSGRFDWQPGQTN